MVMKGFTRRFEPLKLIPDSQIEEIHRATLGVLQGTGVRFESKKALTLFEKNGCIVDRNTRLVKFPPHLVEECLRITPSSFYWKARDSSHDLLIGGNTVYFCSFPGKNIVDLDTWEPRTATRKENEEGIIILDALENLHVISPYTPYFEIEDVPPVMTMVESVANKIKNSSKLFFDGHQQGSEIFIMQMGQAVEMEIQGMFEAAPPLTYYEDAINAAFRYLGEGNLPLHITAAGIMGGTGPATIAGSIVTGNAELIAGIVLSQLIKPGARIVACDFMMPQDMRSGFPAFGSIEAALHSAVFNQIWRKYEIPIQTISCALPSSKKIDFQNGYEKSLASLISALTGAHIVQLHGSVHGELTYHPIQSILDDDLAGMIGRFIEGVNVTDETLALDLIHEVGPIPGMFLDRNHTRLWWKKEQFIPKVADRMPYTEWLESGKRDAIDHAKKRMEEILATHKPTPLTVGQEKEIDRVRKEAKKYFKKKGLC
jgi:trimethylamine---corrinoid protein Co-methyltransferase